MYIKLFKKVLMKIVFAEKPSQAQEYAKFHGARERKDGYMTGNGYAVTWTITCRWPGEI
jgi:hypothetical protein